MRPMEGAYIITSASMTKTMGKSRSFADRLLVRGGRRRPLPGALWPNMTLAYITRTYRAEIRLPPWPPKRRFSREYQARSLSWTWRRRDCRVSWPHRDWRPGRDRSEEHTSELQSLMRISYAVFCLKKKKINTIETKNTTTSSRTN